MRSPLYVPGYHMLTGEPLRATNCGLTVWDYSYSWTDWINMVTCETCLEVDQYKKLFKEPNMTKLRAIDQAIFTNDLPELDNKITGQQIWDALHAEFPGVTLPQRTHIINRLINMTRTEMITVKDLYHHLVKYKGRTVEYVGVKKGALTDVAWIGASKTYHLVIDGTLYGADASADIEICPEPAEASTGAGVETKFNPSIRISAKTLRNNFDRYKGWRITPEFFDSVSGILTDVQGTPGAVLIIVVDGKIWNIPESSYVNMKQL